MATLPYNNNSTENATVRPSLSSGTDQTVQFVFIGIIIIVGLIGNSFVIAVVKIFRMMKKTTNYLLANVAAADMTSLLSTAIHLIGGRKGSSSGGALASFLCKFVETNTMTMVSLLVTALTLTLLAAERYNALIKPLDISRRINNGNIPYVIAVIWAVAIAMATPLFITLDYRPDDRNRCSPGGAFGEMRIYVFCLVVSLTLIPFLVIAFVYSKIIYGLYVSHSICSRRPYSQQEEKDNKRLVALLIVLTVVFFVAFVPYGVTLLLKFDGLQNKSPAERGIISRFITGVQFLTLCNCSVNPFIYFFQSSNYRMGFKFIIRKIFCRDTRHYANQLRTNGSMYSV